MTKNYLSIRLLHTILCVNIRAINKLLHFPENITVTSFQTAVIPLLEWGIRWFLSQLLPPNFSSPWCLSQDTNLHSCYYIPKDGFQSCKLKSYIIFWCTAQKKDLALASIDHNIRCHARGWVKQGSLKKEPSHWWGASNSCLFIQVHFILELTTWELQLFNRLTKLRWHLHKYPLEQLQQTLSQNPKLVTSMEITWEYWKFKISFCGSQANGLSSIL